MVQERKVKQNKHHRLYADIDYVSHSRGKGRLRSSYNISWKLGNIQVQCQQVHFGFGHENHSQKEQPKPYQLYIYSYVRVQILSLGAPNL